MLLRQGWCLKGAGPQRQGPQNAGLAPVVVKQPDARQGFGQPEGRVTGPAQGRQDMCLYPRAGIAQHRFGHLLFALREPVVQAGFFQARGRRQLG